MQTQEQKLARRRSDAILSRVEQTLPQFGGRIRDAEEIARDPAVRRDDHDACRMRELALLGVVRVAKADASCEGGGRAGRSGEKVPSAQRFAGRRCEARACARLGAFRRIDADRDDAIARARLEIDRAQALRQRLANRAAKVGAFVVAQKEHDGARRQIVREQRRQRSRQLQDTEHVLPPQRGQHDPGHGDHEGPAQPQQSQRAVVGEQVVDMDARQQHRQHHCAGQEPKHHDDLSASRHQSPPASSL